ncbi:kinase-like domain-containing protein [Xylariaceae sp. FL1272]|nr:kinase-like domain-containing protein [Xylariaceae sp. FL1272]
MTPENAIDQVEQPDKPDEAPESIFRDPRERHTGKIVQDVTNPEEIPVRPKNVTFWYPDGDYWPNGDVIYKDMPYWMETIEKVDTYNKGGNHPIHLGDILDARYEVVHKLGWGGGGLVWLCHDAVTKSWKAVKIMVARHSADTAEVRIYEHLKKCASAKDIEANGVVIPLQQFWVDGPNGRHLCLVLPVLGGTLWDWSYTQTDHDNNRIIRRKEICRKIIKSVKFLHNHGVCHGDIKPQNIMVKIHNLDKLDKSHMIKLMGQPETIKMEKRSGRPPGRHAPRYLVQAPFMWWKRIMTGEIALVDFGSAFFTSDPPEEAKSLTRMYAAPELYFGNCGPPGPAADIWALGCTLLKATTDNSVFGSLEDDLEDAPRDLEVFLGPLPEPFRSGLKEQLRWDSSSDSDVGERGNEGNEDLQEATLANNDKDLDTRADELNPFCFTHTELAREIQSWIGKSGYSSALEGVIGGRERRRPLPGKEKGDRDSIRYYYPRADVTKFAAFLSSIFRYQPGDRPTIDEISDHPWLKRSKLTVVKETAEKILLSDRTVFTICALMMLLSAAIVTIPHNQGYSSPMADVHCYCSVAASRPSLTY